MKNPINIKKAINKILCFMGLHKKYITKDNRYSCDRCGKTGYAKWKDILNYRN